MAERDFGAHGEWEHPMDYWLRTGNGGWGGGAARPSKLDDKMDHTDPSNLVIVEEVEPDNAAPELPAINYLGGNAVNGVLDGAQAPDIAAMSGFYPDQFLAGHVELYTVDGSAQVRPGGYSDGQLSGNVPAFNGTGASV